MNTRVRTLPLSLPGPRHARLRAAIDAALAEAGRLWTDIVGWHADQRAAGGPWPNRSRMDAWTKGRYALHSQTVQQIGHRLLGNVEATMTRRREDPSTRRWLKLPHHPKDDYPLHWPAQAVSHNPATGRMLLPMGRGRKSLIIPGVVLGPGEAAGAVSLSKRRGGYEISVCVRVAEAGAMPPGQNQAAADPGIIHQTVTTDRHGNGLAVSGRGIRALKRHRGKRMRQIARKQKRCVKGSRRWKRLQAAKNTLAARTARRVKDLRHKGLRALVDWCVRHEVGELFVGDPRGVAGKRSGRKHNRRTSQWEIGEDLRLLKEKAQAAGIRCFTGDERGTSSTCPVCGARRKVTGRVWRCRDAACGFEGHRDVVGSVNMHPLAFGQKVTIPRRQDVTYLHPGPVRKGRPARSIRPDTGHGGHARRVASRPPCPDTATPLTAGRGRRDPQSGAGSGTLKKPIHFSG